jgi:hypothetical protein
MPRFLFFCMGKEKMESGEEKEVKNKKSGGRK